MKLLIYARRDWSFENIKPVLEYYEYDRWYLEMGNRPDFSKYDLIITCEPNITGWRKIHPELKGKHKILALQQSLFWSDIPNPNASYRCDKYLVWGEQMRESCLRNGLEDERIIVAGNPRFDKFFDMPTEKGNKTIVLGGGMESFIDYPGFDAIITHFQPHPQGQGHKMPDDTEELIRTANRVVFRNTGAGIIAMIMKKPVMILRHDEPNKRYHKSELYGIGDYGIDNKFVKWAVGEDGATERVRRVIEEEIL